MPDLNDINFSDPVMMEVLEHLIPPINAAWNLEMDIQEAYRAAYKVSKKSPQALPAWGDLGTTIRDLWRERYAQTQRDYATGSGSGSNKKPDPVYMAFCEVAILKAPKRNLRQTGEEDVSPSLEDVANHMVDEFLPSEGEVKTACDVKTATNITVYTPGARSRKK